MLLLNNLTRLFHFILITLNIGNSIEASKSTSKYDTYFNTVYEKIKNSEKATGIFPNLRRQRRTQGVCTESTCIERLSVSIRLIPFQDKLSEAENLLTECSLPSSIKQFKQFQKEMFVARVCLSNIPKLMAVKKKNTIIEKLEGGTKTSRSKFIRRNPKKSKEKTDCNGGCCKDCPDHKIKTVIMTTTNYDAISSIVDGCIVDDREPEKVTVNNVEKHVFDMCRNDKHILKNLNQVTMVKTYRDKNFFKCKRACEESQVLDITAVTSNRVAMGYAEKCAYSDSFNKDEIIKKGNTYTSTMRICRNDRLNLIRMKGVESAVPVCGIIDTLSTSCGVKWKHAAPICCEGLVCDDRGKCVPDKEACEEGTCCKTCLTSDDPEDTIDVLITVSSGKGKTFGESCIISDIVDREKDELGQTVYSASICKDDFDTIESNPYIWSIVKNDGSMSTNTFSPTISGNFNGTSSSSSSSSSSSDDSSMSTYPSSSPSPTFSGNFNGTSSPSSLSSSSSDDSSMSTYPSTSPSPTFSGNFNGTPSPSSSSSSSSSSSFSGSFSSSSSVSLEPSTLENSANESNTLMPTMSGTPGSSLSNEPSLSQNSVDESTSLSPSISKHPSSASSLEPSAGSSTKSSTTGSPTISVAESS